MLVITTIIEPKEVIFPYYGKTDAKIIKLVEYKDYEILSQIYEQDKFVQSWILYEKGDKSHAMCIARDAMQVLEPKPEKTDLRWRLVYPAFLYEDMKTYAKMAGNNAVLMLALTREESYFNPNAQSYVGAVGLMQLMPETAKEINRIRSLGMQSLDELKDSDTNMKLGNFYYNFLLNNLGQNNILSVASYNGGIGSINRWKEGLEYRDIDEFVQNIDYGPTILDLAGVEVPEDMHGESFLPLLKGEKVDDWRKSLYYHFYEYPAEHAVKRHYGVRTDRYKLIHFYNDIDEWELYDLKEDPSEMNNLYGKAGYEEITKQLQNELVSLQKQYNDTTALKLNNF